MHTLSLSLVSGKWVIACKKVAKEDVSDTITGLLTVKFQSAQATPVFLLQVHFPFLLNVAHISLLSYYGHKLMNGIWGS